MTSLRTRGQSLFYIHLSNILFAATALIISQLSSGFDGYFTTFARFLIGAIIGMSQLAATRTPFRVTRWKPWIGRGIFGALAMTLYYVSIALGSPGRASLFNNSFPIVVAIIAICFLRENLKPSTVAGVIVSFAGVALVLWDGEAGSIVADAAGVASGIFAGISYHFNKQASQTEHPTVIYLGVCFVGLIATVFSLPQAVHLDVRSCILLALAGSGAYFAQITITMGLRDVDTTEGSIHTFAKIPLTIVGSWLLFGERITPRFIAGTLMLFIGIMLDQVASRKKRSRYTH